VRDAAFGVLARMQERLKKVLNSYPVGDLVLVDAEEMNMRKGKLLPRYYGPWTVVAVYKAI
jgi:ribosomal protein L21E